jgi:hypothetical protein
MLWQTSIAPQWLTPRGEAAMICLDRSGLGSEAEQDRILERWRS